MNQVTARLDSIDHRATFLEEVEQWLLSDTASEGLNRKHRWMRLPVCLPSGNAWARGFFALTGLHILLLGFVFFLSLLALITRAKGARRDARYQHIQWWWHVTCLTGVALFLLFYVG